MCLHAWWNVWANGLQEQGACKGGSMLGVGADLLVVGDQLLLFAPGGFQRFK